jgi:hypothetical protein
LFKIGENYLNILDFEKSNEVGIMPVISINFNKISIERKEVPTGSISINNNIALKEVDRIDLSAGTAKQDGLKFKFELAAKYEPNFAELTINGDVIYLDASAKVKQILDGWNKNKNVQKEIFEQVMNAALTKANIQALILSQILNLPPPIQLPKLHVSNTSSKK